MRVGLPLHDEPRPCQTSIPCSLGANAHVRSSETAQACWQLNRLLEVLLATMLHVFSSGNLMVS